MNNFKLILISLLFALLAISTCLAGEALAKDSETNDIALENPQTTLNIDLMNAFQERHSTTSFLSSQEVSLKDLSTILWAANGINRQDGKRTTPSPFGQYFFHIYVASSKGVYLYEPTLNKLKFISDQNIKYEVGMQPDIPTAFYVLIITAKLSEVPTAAGSGERMVEMIHGAAGCVCENVYLTASALHLGTRMVATVNKPGIINNLNFSKDDMVLYIMPIGYPKK